MNKGFEDSNLILSCKIGFISVKTFMQAADSLSDCFGGVCKAGWNLMTIWMDDSVNEDIKFGRELYSGFITDLNLTNLNFLDAITLSDANS